MKKITKEDLRKSYERVKQYSLLDIDYFFVAFLSGIAGCFSIYWPKTRESLVGIAISVALIPPIVLLGIGLAQLDKEIIYSSSTIVLINIIGIIIGNLFTLLFFKLLQAKNNDTR